MGKFVFRAVRIGLALVVAGFASWATNASATITQGDFSIFGNFREQIAGRWGEGSDRNPAAPTNFNGGGLLAGAGSLPSHPASRSGGSFDFNHWDLVEFKTIADLRPDYHFVKNYNFLGRLDTLFIKDADFFAIYRGWYDAFPDLKSKGVSQANTDALPYTQRQKVEQFQRDDLREYYGQVNVTDDWSFRIGKQEVIWSEADALSGTEVINPADLRVHWIHFDSPEDQRRNLRMVKMNYVLGDMWKTANNELEAFWIPGDFEGAGPLLNTTDKRSPYFIRLATANYNPFVTSSVYNQKGQLTKDVNLSDGSQAPLYFVNLQCAAGPCGPSPVGGFFDFTSVTRSTAGSNSLKNSEFGARYSTLLPIGNGLQVSFIYEWLYRATKTGVDNIGAPPPCVDAGTCTAIVGPSHGAAVSKGAGVWITANTSAANSFYGQRKGGLPIDSNCFAMGGFGVAGVPTSRCGQFLLDLAAYTQRTNFFGVTGTYYEKSLTDVVIRYDLAYLPKASYFEGGPAYVTATPAGPAKGISADGKHDYGSWTDKVEGILAFDRPTYIPWISKQHTFLVAQMTTSWYPGIHDHPLLSIASAGGKFRKIQNLGLLAAVDYLFDGRLTTTNALLWDIDDNTGFLTSTNAFRYSRNVIANVNAAWYLGLSGRFTDPVLLSRSQQINELEFRLAYEI